MQGGGVVANVWPCQGLDDSENSTRCSNKQDLSKVTLTARVIFSVALRFAPWFALPWWFKTTLDNSLTIPWLELHALAA